ncbi:hypothetical protein AAH446_03360 [Erwinia sp. P6884]|uniref:hypothetical protein n=1 Tax=Erwinia sp. P6884 TaxID=3141450 RepID=UPI0031979043
MPQAMGCFYMSSSVKKLIKSVNKHFLLYIQLDNRANERPGLKDPEPSGCGNSPSMEKKLIPPTHAKHGKDTDSVGDTNTRHEGFRNSEDHPERQVKKDVINVFNEKMLFLVKYQYVPLTGMAFSPVLNKRCSLLVKNNRLLNEFLYFTLADVSDIKDPSPGNAFPVADELLAKLISAIVTGAKEGVEYYYHPEGSSMMLHTCKSCASFSRSIYKIINDIKPYDLIVTEELQPAYFIYGFTLIVKNNLLNSVLNRVSCEKLQSEQYGNNFCIFSDSKGTFVKLCEC